MSASSPPKSEPRAQSAAQPPPRVPGGPRVFIAYSRKDSAFVQRLAHALDARGYLPDFDQSDWDVDTGVAATDEWWRRLMDMIAATDVVVLVVSPDSALSPVVEREISYASSLSKRLIAITCRATDFSVASPRLSALNVNHWFVESAFDAAVEKVCHWLQRDAEWLRAAARYTLAAKRWNDSDRSPDRLLFGQEISAAEGWSARRPESAPPVTESVLEYVAASRKAQAGREAVQLNQIRRTRRLQRWVGATIGIAFVITFIGAGAVIRGQRALSRSQSLTLARTAQRLLEDGDTLRAARLGILAARDSFLHPSAPEAATTLAAAAQKLPLEMSFAHAGSVGGAAYSPDNELILTWTSDERRPSAARLWNATSGEQVGPALTQDGAIRGALFSKDGRTVYSWGLDKTARLWQTSSGRQLGQSMEHEGFVVGAMLSPDQSRLLTWYASVSSPVGAAMQWDASTGRQIGPQLLHGVAMNAAAYSHDGARILTWGVHRWVSRWDSATGDELLPPLLHDARVDGAVFSADDRRILSWSGDGGTDAAGDVRVWDAASGTPLSPVIAHQGAVFGALFSKDETRILSWGSDATARVWDASTGQPSSPALRHDGAVTGAIFSKDESRILTWSEDGTARLWDASSGRQAGAAFAHAGPILGATFSPSEDRVLTWSTDRTARLWDIATGRQLGASFGHDAEVSGAAFSDDGAHVLTWSGDGNVRVWTSAPEQQLGRGFTHASAVEDGVFIDELRVLTWSRRDGVHVWNADTGGAAVDGNAFVPLGPRGLAGVALTQDRRRMVTWDGAKFAQLWDVAAAQPVGEPLEHDTAVDGARFSPDGTRLVTWARLEAARLWDAANGRALWSPEVYRGRLDGVAFSADGSRMLTWDFESGMVRQWATATGAPIEPAVFHDDVANASYSSDARRILTVGYDGWPQTKRSDLQSVRVWDAASGRQLDRIRQAELASGAVFYANDTKILSWGTTDTTSFWEASTGRELPAPVLADGANAGLPIIARRALYRNDDGALSILRDSTVSADGRRALTWSKIARIRDTDTGYEVAAFEHDRSVKGAALSPSGERVLIWDTTPTARVWSARWAMSRLAAARLAPQVCAEKLRGPNVVGTSPPPGARATLGPRQLDGADSIAAPILRGREGEDVCQWVPAWYDAALQASFGWAFRQHSDPRRE